MASDYMKYSKNATTASSAANNNNYAAPQSTTANPSSSGIVDVLPPTGSLRSNSSSSKTSKNTKKSSRIGNIRSKLSLSQSLSQTSTIDEDAEYNYPHHATTSASAASNLYTSNDAAFQLQAALSKSLSMESHRSYNSSYSEDAHAGGPGDGTSIAHTIHNTKKKFRLPNRYRGFSTSISSLFLDESIVCGALSCCGVILSSRTEHLLNERNIKRGVTRRGGGYGKEGAQRAP
eukprot:scaffold10627_cov86-Skeletonema_marinoi.AAC.1